MTEPPAVDFWYDQLARGSRRFGPKVAFETYRNLLDGSGVDPYREPMFDRVWAAAEPKRSDTIFGLQFDGIEIEGALSWQAHPWREAVKIMLAELSDRLLVRVEEARDPWHDFVAFAERFKRDLDTGDGFELSDWQRGFAEAVESGSVPLSEFAAAGGRSGKKWQADVLKAYNESREPARVEPPTGLDALQQIVESVQSSDPKPVAYMVLDPAVASGTHFEGRDGVGQRYVRIPAAALDHLMGLPQRPPPGSNGQLGAAFGIKIYRREDLPKNWPRPLAAKRMP